MQSWGRAGHAQVAWMSGVYEPMLSKVPKELLRVQNVAVAASSAISWDHSVVFVPRELCRVSELHWTGAGGEAAVPAVPAVPTCAGPAPCAHRSSPALPL